MSQNSSDDDLWCRRYRPARNATVRLVCLPHAGGSATFFLPVSAALSPGVDVVAIQYPGRQDRRAESPIDDIAALADRIHATVRRQPEMPLILFGHSMGAVIGFEVTRRLEAEGHGPAQRLAELLRSEGLGARLVDVGQDPETVTWVVMADPEGNEFCVVRPKETLTR